MRFLVDEQFLFRLNYYLMSGFFLVGIICCNKDMEVIYKVELKFK